MLLKNIFLKTLRDYRLSILLWGLALAALMAATAKSYPTFFIEGQNKAAQIADLQKLANSFSFLTGPATDLNILGGFVTWRLMNTLGVLVSIFGLLMGSALIRGEEEKGTLDVLLSTPHSRPAVLLQKWAAMFVAIMGIMALSWVGLVASAKSIPGYDLDAGAAGLAHLNLGLLAFFYGTLALCLGQVFISRKAAAGWTGGVLAATFLLNSLGQSASSLNWMQYASPFYYYSQSRPLSPSVGMSWGGVGVLLIITLPLLIAALAMYLRRDHNNVFRFSGAGQVVRPRRAGEIAEPKSPWLANSFMFSFRANLTGILIWSFLVSVYALIIVSVSNTIKDDYLKIISENELYKNFGFGRVNNNETLLELTFFVIIGVIYAAYAIIQVLGWNSEETEGRLELVLSTPQPRWQLLAVRFAATILASGIMTLITGLVFALGTVIFGVAINGGNLAAAFFGLWVICIIVAAAGFGLAAVGPRWAITVLSTLVVVSFLADLLASLFKLPDWVSKLSIFRQYGQPIINGLDALPQLVILSLSAVFIALAIFRFSQRDILKS